MRIFHDVPEFGEDERQAQFREAIAKMKRENPEVRYHVTSMNGFPASKVDLGWLQGRISRFWHRESVSVQDLAAVLHEEVPLVVQRLKQIEISTGSGAHLVIRLKTKDDHGWYVYKFVIHLGMGLVN